MDYKLELLLVYIIFINVLSFITCVADKIFAVRGKRRISEKFLFLIALLGGSVGMYAAMYIVRHKTKHLSFTLGIPAIMLFQIIGLFLIIK